MTWKLTHYDRPWTVNAERTWHYHKRATFTRAWREAFFQLALAEKLPKPFLRPVLIWAAPMLKGKRFQDAGACFPAVKAAIDGLVDAGVLMDDDGQHVYGIIFLRPELGMEQDSLTLMVHET